MWAGLSHSIRSCSLAETPSHCHWRDIWPPKPFVSVGKQFDVSFIIPPVLRLWDIGTPGIARACCFRGRTLMQVALNTVHPPQGVTTVAVMVWLRTRTKTTQRILNSL
jgi:hypothetical protein